MSQITAAAYPRKVCPRVIPTNPLNGIAFTGATYQNTQISKIQAVDPKTLIITTYNSSTSDFQSHTM